MTGPARRDKPHPAGRGSRTAAAMRAAVTLAALALVVSACGSTEDPARAEPAAGAGDAAEASTVDRSAPDGSAPATSVTTTSPAPPSTTTTAPPPPPPPPPVLAIFGDSTGLMTGFGLAGWFVDGAHGVVVPGRVELGCSIVRGGQRRTLIGVGQNHPTCEDRDTTWGEKLAPGSPTLAVVQTGPWDVIDHLLVGDSVWRGPGDPVYDDRLRQEMAAVVDLLSTHGAHVVWLTLPRQGVEVGQVAGSESAPGTDPARAARYNELLFELAVARPGKVTIVDLAGWLESSGRMAELLPDGIHVSFDTSRPLADAWLGRAVLDAWTRAAGAHTGRAS